MKKGKKTVFVFTGVFLLLVLLGLYWFWPRSCMEILPEDEISSEVSFNNREGFSVSGEQLEELLSWMEQVRFRKSLPLETKGDGDTFIVSLFVRRQEGQEERTMIVRFQCYYLTPESSTVLTENGSFSFYDAGERVEQLMEILKLSPE